MFHTLRRLILFGCAAMILGAGYVLYRNREVFEPAADFIELWRESQGKRRDFIGVLEGEAVRVIDGATFQLKAGDGQYYNLRLAGVDPYSWQDPKTRRTTKMAGASRTNLSQLILDQPVRVELTFTNTERSGLGIVFCQDQNVNVQVIEAGMARLKLDWIKTLPLSHQHRLLTAQQKAQELKVGVWE